MRTPLAILSTRVLTKLTIGSILAGCLTFAAAPAAAQERLCDPSFENCRTPLIELIRNERVGIDAAWWFMTDARYTHELIQRWRAGVPVRIIIDPRANSTYPANADRLRELRDAGIPMRQKVSGGILHWKMMLFAGQNTVQFSAANYSPFAFVPVDPYRAYTDEVIYFSTVPSVVNSFMTRFDDLWTSTSGYSNYANVSGTLTRNFPRFSLDPELNFPPQQSFRNRSVSAYNAETQQIDAIIFRITDRAHTDALIAALARGVRVRIITDWGQYTWSERLWHAWNVDRLYRAGAQIRVAGEKGDRVAAAKLGHWGTMHQKSTILHSQRMTIFGSSNWTSPSTESQEEHNYFTRRSDFFQYFRNHFDRKWNNSNPVGAVETEPLVPLPPDAQTNISPANGATGQSTTVTLRWRAGIWTHLYDIYLGTTPDPPLLSADRELGPSMSSTDHKTFTVPNLLPGTTYYWRIVGKTMAHVPRSGPVWSFTTAGTPPTQPPPGGGSLPSGWSSRDVGSVGRTGSAGESSGTFTLQGSGADVWGTADGFHFAYRSLSGDGEIVARVASLQASHHWAKAGVMIRESLSAGSRHAFMLVSPARGLAFQRRAATGGESTHTDGGSGTAPVWVRLVRSGNTFHAYRSSNGSSWSLVGSQTISMGSTVQAGLALTSHDNAALATARFDNVRVQTGSTSPPPPASLPSGWSSRDIGSVGRAGSTSHSSGVYTVRGSGADVWGTADGFHFAYRSLSGNGQIVARVASLQGSHHWAKAGVMFRDTLQAGSRHAFMLVSPGRGLAFQRRASTGGESTHTDGGGGTAPVWVRLVRSGNTFQAYRSSNGTSWTLVGSQTISMGTTVQVGLALTSHDNSALATATFDNVQVASQ